MKKLPMKTELTEKEHSWYVVVYNVLKKELKKEFERRMNKQ